MRVILYALIVAVVAVSAATAYNMSQITSARRTTRGQTCDAFRAYNKGLVGLIRDGEKLLPSFRYYRDHPDDLRRAIANDEQAVRVITGNLPDYC